MTMPKDETSDEQRRWAITALKGASHGEGIERLRNMIASYFDNEDAEYTPDEIRAGNADHCIVKALALTPSEQGSGLREALEEARKFIVAEVVPYVAVDRLRRQREVLAKIGQALGGHDGH